MIEKTLILLKPDAVQRSLMGEIITRFEKRGLKIIAMKLIQANQEKAYNHYNEDISKRHGEHVRTALVNYIQESPILVLVIEGVHAINAVRKMTGSTYPGDAEIGTIRGDYAHASKEFIKINNKGRNLIHASANKQDAKREISIWFNKNELLAYKTVHDIHTL